jgi:hypothetical protein
MSSRIVATRTFRTPSGGQVLATVFEPVMTRPDEWSCAFAITGLAREVTAEARGVDGLQALMLASQGIRFHLEASGEALTWVDGEPGEYGIPRPIPDSYGVEIERHLTKLVGDEVARLVQAKVQARRPPSDEKGS